MSKTSSKLLLALLILASLGPIARADDSESGGSLGALQSASGGAQDAAWIMEGSRPAPVAVSADAKPSLKNPVAGCDMGCSETQKREMGKKPAVKTQVPGKTPEAKESPGFFAKTGEWLSRNKEGFTTIADALCVGGVILGVVGIALLSGPLAIGGLIAAVAGFALSALFQSKL